MFTIQEVPEKEENGTGNGSEEDDNHSDASSTSTLTEPEVNIEMVPEAIQIVRTTISGRKFVVYVFRAGFVRLSSKASEQPWQALGEHLRSTNDQQETEIEFYFHK